MFAGGSSRLGHSLVERIHCRDSHGQGAEQLADCSFCQQRHVWRSHGGRLRTAERAAQALQRAAAGLDLQGAGQRCLPGPG